MERYEHDLIVIGAGPAGIQAAVEAARAGRRVALIERQPVPGGAMVNTGTLPSKALRETALLCSSFRRMPMPGLDIAMDRSISVPRFMARRHLLEHQEHDRLESMLDAAGVGIQRGTGRLIDAHRVRLTSADGTERDLSAAFILVATGSSPVRPDHVPFDHWRVVDADGVLELGRLPDRLVVVGAGVIGCEYACVFAEMGVAVTILHARADVLPFLDHECRDHLVTLMEQAGVGIRADVTVESIRADDHGVVVHESNGTTYSGDILLWAAGRQSNTNGLGLEDAGVALGARGLITVDDTYRTNVPSIYAAGDVIGFPALASTSMQQGRIAAAHMFDLPFDRERDARFPMGLYTIPGVSAVGLTESEALDAGETIVVGRAAYRDNPRGRMLGDEDGLLKCVFRATTGELLGASIVGEQATELIHLAQALLDRDDALTYLRTACFNYPSLAELFRAAAEDAHRALDGRLPLRRAA